LSAHREVPLQSLAGFLPEGTFEKVLPFLLQYKIHLTVTKERQSVLGDYRYPDRHRGHRITVNGNLNPYAFLLTLVHEIAHLVAFLQHGYRIAPHGAEWKKTYRDLLLPFLGQGYLPPDVEQVVQAYGSNLKATSCTDEDLMRVLHRYDKRPEHHCLVEDLEEGALFRTRDQRIFRKGPKLRKRYQCEDAKSGKVYLFSPVYVVERVTKGKIS